jgi:FAD-linked oxidoreductase
MSSPVWSNWAGNQTAMPKAILRPETETELAAIVGRGVAERHRVRVVGSGHSFTDIACTGGLLVDLEALEPTFEIDSARQRVTVGAGIVLADLNRRLWAAGLSLPNLGDIDRQTIAGATSTATHGTGANYQCISAAIVGARLVTGDGSVIDVSDQHRPDLLDGIRVGLGAIGIIVTLTLQCEPAFNLHAVESTHDIDEILDAFDETASLHDHVEFFWLPHTSTGLLKTNTRTTEPIARRPRLNAFVNDELLANVGLSVLNSVGRRFPTTVPKLINGVMKPGERTEYVAPAHEVFCSSRRVRFVEMEYAIPRQDLLEAFGRVRRLVDGMGQPISFPVEVRVLGADDIPLGSACGRETGYVAVHVHRSVSHESYFAAVESIMADYGGRPHWGKLHRQTATTLAPLYPRWDDFQKVLAELDPDGHFSNTYLNRVLRDPGFGGR